jgi:hypothetical protein
MKAFFGAKTLNKAEKKKLKKKNKNKQKKLIYRNIVSFGFSAKRNLCESNQKPTTNSTQP